MKAGGRALVGSTVWISLCIMTQKDTIQLGDELESEGGVFLRSGFCFCSFESRKLCFLDISSISGICSHVP